MKIKKILPYLLLNIGISAVTMLAVILIWNALHPSTIDANQFDGSFINPLQTSPAVLPPLDHKTIEIQSVFMPGELDYEKISLKNVGEDPIDLAGWSLVNSQKEKFIIPALTLYPDGAVDVYSRPGINTAVELFWNSAQALWRPGDTVLLLDTAGDERSNYLIP